MKIERQWPFPASDRVPSVAALEHSGNVKMPATIVAVGTDPRIAQLVALYNKMDERGKITIIRMAAVMPKEL